MIPNGHITVYNKYIDSVTRAEKFQRTEIRNVVWQATKAVSGMQAGYLASNVATILIPFDRGTNYEKPKAWQANRAGWTLQEGDIIARGIVTDEITTEYSVTDLRADYDDVVIITSVDDMDHGSPQVKHWEVGCK